ncbi:MAG: SOS response-associated peptidase [Bythopirellula sp.]|nr:SOS response-associated peptidase [Bythopirellula sp.]
MCGRFSLRAKLNSLLQQFGAEMVQEWDIVPRYNIAPTQQISVIRQVDGSRELSMMRWGLVPPWADSPKAGPVLNNARSEDVAQKPTFRSIIKNKRCLIPADGFFEWEKIGKQKQPHYFGITDFQPFAFAGLWQVWKHDDARIESCAILTTHANEMVGKIHDRMPVILSPGDYDLWLNPDKQDPTELTYLYEPFASADMETYLVDPEVNNARNEGPESVKPVSYGIAEQKPLFPTDDNVKNST